MHSHSKSSWALILFGKAKGGVFSNYWSNSQLLSKVTLEKKQQSSKKAIYDGKVRFLLLPNILYNCSYQTLFWLVLVFSIYFSQRNPWHSKCLDHHGKVRILLHPSILYNCSWHGAIVMPFFYGGFQYYFPPKRARHLNCLDCQMLGCKH